MKKIIAMAAAGVLAMVLAGCGGSTEEPAFDEQEMVGKTVLEFSEVVLENDYDCTILSADTGTELNNDFSTMSEEVMGRWYVYECDADHAKKKATISITSEQSPLYDEIS